MRWLRFGLVASLLGASLVVAAPAQALQPHPPLEPVRFPGSTLKQSAPDMSPREWNRFLKGHPELRPVTTTTGNWAKMGLRGAGHVASALFGLEVGTHIAGVFGLPTTGDFWCDLATATIDSTCGLSADPVYVPNSDLQPGMVGWVGTPSAQVPLGSQRPNHSVWVSILHVDAPEWGVNGQISYSASIGTDGAANDVCRGGGSTSVMLVGGGGSRNLSNFAEYWPNPCGGGEPLPMPRHYTMNTGANGSAPLDLMVGSQVVATWYPQGHPNRPPDMGDDPQTWWRTTWRCDAAAPQIRESATFRESDGAWPSIPVAECDPGAVVTSMLVEQMWEAGVRETIIDWELDQTGIDWNTEYPQCADGSCILDLLRIDPQTDRRLSCFSNPALCYDWFEDPNKASKWECRYAGTVVALNECNVYRRAWPNPQTRTDPDYSDPDPENPDPPTVWVPPGERPDLDFSPPRTELDDACPPDFTWLSLFNPWWYYKGVACALGEAFVPSGSVSFQGVQQAWKATAIGQVQTVFNDPLGFGGNLFDTGGVLCGVILDVEVPVLDGQRLVVDTCEGIWQEAGGIRTVIAALFIVAAILGGLWVILGTVRIRTGGEGAST